MVIMWFMVSASLVGDGRHGALDRVEQRLARKRLEQMCGDTDLRRRLTGRRLVGAHENHRDARSGRGQLAAQLEARYARQTHVEHETSCMLGGTRLQQRLA